MELAIKEAIKAREKQEVPVGAIIVDKNGNDILDEYDEFVNSNIISDISISKEIKNYKITLGSDNIFNYKDPENLPNNPGRIIYSKITITL